MKNKRQANEIIPMNLTAYSEWYRIRKVRWVRVNLRQYLMTWIYDNPMGLSEELEVLEQEKTLFYRQNVSQRKLERSEDEIEW